MRAAFDAGGTVVGVLPRVSSGASARVDTRSAVAEGHAVLVSPYHPAAAFSAGAAMGRNKLIYAFADVAVVVSPRKGRAAPGRGAIEAIEGGWVPVVVRSGPGVSAGETPSSRAALRRSRRMRSRASSRVATFWI